MGPVLSADNMRAYWPAAPQSLTGLTLAGPPADPKVIAAKLAIAHDARAKGRSGQDAAQLV